MIQPFLKLAALTVAVLTVGFLAVFWVRQAGLHQEFAATPHPWFQRTTWKIYEPSDEELCGRAPLDQSQGWIYAVTVRKKDTEWITACGPLSELLSLQPA